MTMRFLILILLGLLTTGAMAADEPSEAEMMQAYLDAAVPGEQHAWLASRAGQWTCTVRSWMDPAADPMVSQGSETATMALGGRFLESSFSGEMMGMPFEGRGVMGYDNGRKLFVGTWYDSMGTGIMNYEGEYDAAKKELVCHGSYVDPVTGQTQQTTMVTRELGPDAHVFEMWGPGPTGENVKWMEMEYRRSK